MKRNDWWRVSKARPCPVCGQPDWCLLTGPESAPTAAICARQESPKRCGDAGWLHRLTSDPWQTTRGFRTVALSIPTTTPTSKIDFQKLAARCENSLTERGRFRLAEQLGLTEVSLRRLKVGWTTKYGAFTFPMRDANGDIVGIRLRRPDGSKFSVTGGREGLFLPEGLALGGQLCITEGPTDCAALLDAGMSAIGRPNCSGGLRHVVALVERLRPSDVAILADGDEPGRRGAENLAALLVAYVPVVRVAMPPAGIKDARAWRCSGATAADFTTAIEAAVVRRLAITATSRKDATR